MNRTLALLPAILLIVSACAAGEPAPSVPGSPGASPPSSGSPDDPVSGPPAIDFPLPGGGGGPTNVVPRPGQRNVREVAVEAIEARVDSDRIAVRLTWTSGVEPCYVLDSVLVARAGDTVTLTVREGSGPEDVACIEIAQQKSTVVELGSFAPGRYTIAASLGAAAPIEVTVS